ncbi:hypothetical protein Aglo03_37530 [Actinokineospora globicatena]|uniref:Uncharacterized protein n=1 Tax=Actinokineospora globicatena TaxID=103729 RepID=A0A9W6QNR8_9PSEU|nr:hypothetical protein Aglo03_37530 [Actinokineospora globicatena]
MAARAREAWGEPVEAVHSRQLCQHASVAAARKSYRVQLRSKLSTTDLTGYPKERTAAVRARAAAVRLRGPLVLGDHHGALLAEGALEGVE